jgi:hypothetical protein
MSRYFSRDIKKAVIDRLNDATYGVNTILTAMDTERTESLSSKSLFLRISDSYFEQQNPEMFVHVVNSEIADGNLNESILNCNENYTINIFAQIKEMSDDLDLILDNYEEAIKRCLHGANLSGINYIYNKNSQKLNSGDGNIGFYGAVELNFIANV